MKRALTILVFVSLIAGNAFSAYVIVLKDGSRLKAKEKWTVVNGKAVVKLDNGQVATLNPAEIDVAASEQVSKMGLGNVNILNADQQANQNTQQRPQPQGQSLGDQVRAMRPRVPLTTTTAATTQPTPAPVTTAPVLDQLDSRVRDKFERAFENVGIYEHKLAGTDRQVRAELTADSEDRVFNALSATAFLVGHNAGIDGLKIDLVEIFMKTTNGGAAGRFQMNRADADAINGKTITLQDYFVRKVIY